MACTGDNLAAIRAERHTVDPTVVSLEGMLRIGRRKPELDRLVHTPRGYKMAVRAEGHGNDIVLVAVEGVELAVRSHGPKLDALVLSRGDQELAIGAELEGADEALMAGIGPNRGACDSVPEPDGRVEA